MTGSIRLRPRGNCPLYQCFARSAASRLCDAVSSPPARYIVRPSARQCSAGNSLFRGWSVGFESPTSASAGEWFQTSPPLLQRRYFHSLRESIHIVTGARLVGAGTQGERALRPDSRNVAGRIVDTAKSGFQRGSLRPPRNEILGSLSL